MAFLDFIQDTKVKFDTQARAFIDLQIKNNTLGEWNDLKGEFTKFTGKVLKEDGTVIELSKMKKNEIMQYIKTNLGFDEEEFNMHTKGFLNFAHAVRERTKKEFKKHYNSIYSMEATIDEFLRSKNPGIFKDTKQIDLLESVIKKATNIKYPEEINSNSITIGSNYARPYIKSSQKMVGMLKRQEFDNEEYEVLGHSMDLIGTTAMFKILKSDKPYTSSDDLFKDTMKEIDKFIDRGAFNEFYKEKNSKAIFDELTGQRNTGKTHTYATNLRKTGTDILNMNPNDIMNTIGNVKGLSSDYLKNLQRIQKYSAHSMDLFADNMIESAISAKHGLTLGGLEGSKIFTNKLLSRNSESLNNLVLGLYEDVFVKGNNEIKTVNLLSNIVSFKKGFDDQSSLLETVVSKAEEEGLNSQLLYKSIDLGEKEFKRIYGDLIKPKQIELYNKYRKEYKFNFDLIEKELQSKLLDKTYVKQDEFELYKGLNLFGEMLIQNDPGLEYDINDAYELLEKYKKGDIGYKELMSNKEINNLFHQAYTSLGSAASISTVSLTKDYINAYQRKYYNDLTNIEVTDFLKTNFLPILAEVEKERTGKKNINIDDYDISDYFNIENTTGMYTKKLAELAKKEEKIDDFLESNLLTKFVESIERKRDNNNTIFYKRLLTNTNNPISEYAMAMNINNAIFNHEGKTGEESLRLLKEYYANGLPSMNESPLSISLEKLHGLNNNFINSMIGEYSKLDPNFETFDLEEVLEDLLKNDTTEDQNKTIVRRINNAINSAVLENNYKNLNIVNPFAISKSNSNIKKLIINKIPDYIEKDLFSKNKAVLLNAKTKKGNTDFRKIFNYIKNSKDIFYIDDLKSFESNNRSMNVLRGYFLGQNKKNRKIFTTKDVAKKLVSYDEKTISNFITSAQKQELAQDMLNAFKYLGEDLTEKNALKRLKGKFDSDLLSKILVERDINNNKNYYENMMSDSLKFDNYKNKLINNLSNILKDYKNIDFSINNRYASNSYLDIAKAFTKENRQYINITNSLGISGYITRMKNIKDHLDYITYKESKWLNEIGINSDAFNKMASLELASLQDYSNSKLNQTLFNVAKALTNKEITNKEFKYNKVFANISKNLSDNKGKAGFIAGILGAGAFAVGKIVKPFFSNSSGKYIAGTTNGPITERELYESLNFTNGMKTNLLNQELKSGDSIPMYLSIYNKKYF